jgi:AhpD family alkylhydroperoxidase
MFDKQLTKRLTSVADFQRYIIDAVRDFGAMRKAIKSGQLSPALRDKIMLAVTEVNGCRYCSYMHSKNAIKAGVSEEEIGHLLSGDLSVSNSEEATALLFAQHYADSKGRPAPETVEKLFNIYGEPKARGILAATRAIMVGNVHGVAIDLLQARLRGNKDPESRFTTEVNTTFGILLFLPLALIRKLFGLLPVDGVVHPNISNNTAPVK